MFPGRPGSGQISSSAYTVPKGAAKFWVEHMKKHKVPYTAGERFGTQFVRFTHPSGLQFEVVEEAAELGLVHRHRGSSLGSLSSRP